MILHQPQDRALMAELEGLASLPSRNKSCAWGLEWR